ncbi:hypothetical protein GUITHDRAFT_146337 [Guillardia theta CCMP2712]|uniref:Uncharacterized protein n=1 Tax=Guillardia theta (strain CCMP2712) TaxID=905079 RepID=L1IH80_GUITC|nr:hypothetical protein GUITHDRAFT_146337 [Guillardia theta CCMP2712]EKX35598.1 hypothetical protein GUITHDRAFT_146337 [Guillardia theta CCMP2712]|eukprot:XP_005822578.1 hypothetical protein GUITHDRAFT_146337 [Guillardia theta CCMP2712]
MEMEDGQGNFDRREEEEEEEKEEELPSYATGGAESIEEGGSGGEEFRRRRVYYQGEEQEMSEAEDYTSEIGDVSSMTSTAWDDISTILDEEDDQIAAEMSFLMQEIEQLKLEMASKQGKSSKELISQIASLQSKIADLKLLDFSDSDASREEGKCNGGQEGWEVKERQNDQHMLQDEGRERGGEEERERKRKDSEETVGDQDKDETVLSDAEVEEGESQQRDSTEWKDVLRSKRTEEMAEGKKERTEEDEEEQDEEEQTLQRDNLDVSERGGEGSLSETAAVMAHADNQSIEGDDVRRRDEGEKEEEKQKMNKFDILKSVLLHLTLSPRPSP